MCCACNVCGISNSMQMRRLYGVCSMTLGNKSELLLPSQSCSMRQCSPEVPEGGQQGSEHHDGPKYQYPCPAEIQGSQHESHHDNDNPPIFPCHMPCARPYTMPDRHGRCCCGALQLCSCMGEKRSGKSHTVELLGKQAAPFVWPCMAMYVVCIRGGRYNLRQTGPKQRDYNDNLHSDRRITHHALPALQHSSLQKYSSLA